MTKFYENAVVKGTTLEKEAGFILYFVTHWICTLYETCGVSICFLASCTISDNIGKPKDRLKKILRRCVNKIIRAAESIFYKICSFSSIMAALIHHDFNIHSNRGWVKNWLAPKFVKSPNFFFQSLWNLIRIRTQWE